MKRWLGWGCLLLCGASLFFFYACLLALARRDYVAGILLMFVGFAVMRGGSELARLALRPEGHR
jgi:hypothetical protein